jgi:hypothetical protein
MFLGGGDGRLAQHPSLYSAARGFGILSVVAVVLIVIFVVLSVYSASQLRPSAGSGDNPTFVPGPNDSVVIHANVSVSNPGYFSLDGLQINTVVRLPGPQGGVLATGSSPVISIASGSAGEIPIVLSVPISAEVDAPLLTHDLVLPGWAYVNATYAKVFAIELTIPRNVTWGAPFANLRVESGGPQPLANGTAEVPLNVSFSDDSNYPIAGAIEYQIEDPVGAECTGGDFPISVGAHSPFRGSSNAYLPPGCEGSGDSVVLTFEGGPWNFPLVRESLG